MSGFMKSGVPWYAHPDTAAIRPREMPPIEAESWRAEKMQAYRYVFQYIRQNWKEGDRFYVTREAREYFNFSIKAKAKDMSIHGGQTGTFIAKEFVGNVNMIRVKWDDPNYKPKGSGKNFMGMFDFFHFAFPIPDDGASKE